MTTEELERDLERLAEPRDDDERLRLMIRARLGDQMPVRNRRSRRPVFGLRWAAGATAVAATAAALVSVSWPGGSTGPSNADAAIIRHALQAITLPANAIVHVKESGVDNGTQISAEWWQQTSPPYTLRIIKGPVGQQSETEDNGTTTFRYDVTGGTILETPDSSPLTLVDPIEAVRDGLAHGGAQVAGTTTIDGTAVYEIDLPGGVVAYFNTANYEPVYLDNPQRDGGVVRTRVVTYEELPMTPDNAQLLSLTAQHPSAHVQTNAVLRPVERG